jgi:hypothetical protein
MQPVIRHKPLDISDKKETRVRFRCDLRQYLGTGTFSVVKNYEATRGRLLWDRWVTGTGEIAAVASSHDQVQAPLSCGKALAREYLQCDVYSDTWPHKLEFWNELIGCNLVRETRTYYTY